MATKLKCFLCKICEERDKEINSKFCQRCMDDIGISKITNNIYLSDVLFAKKYEELKKLKITKILCIGEELINVHKDAPTYFTIKYINIQDSLIVNISQHFDEACKFIDLPANRKDLSKNDKFDEHTLIHCVEGVSRSPTIAIFYLMNRYNFSFETAFSLCKNRRKCIEPNANFINQLKSIN